MKRLLGSSWKRVGLQLGLLAGIGLAFAVGSYEDSAEAGGMQDCPQEGECTFKKPNVMFVVDYSTSMNTVFDQDNNLTRWEVTVAALQDITQPGSYLSQNTHLALMRYGHDPDPDTPGTTIANDSSGIVDGQALDLQWDDDADLFLPCNGQAFTDALNATPAPMNGAMFGIGTWTKGALDASAAEIVQTKADHPEDNDERIYLNVLLTDGAWTSADGITSLSPASENPAITAADLFDNQNIRTYVVAIGGDPDAEMAADETAAAGGTTAAIDADTPALLVDALDGVVADMISGVVVPACGGGLPRVMVLLDASSSMLNIDGGTQPGPPGDTGWDQAREALAGFDSFFDTPTPEGAIADVAHFGLAVFGNDQPNLAGAEAELLPNYDAGEARVLVQYGPCMKDNFYWALDPASSCEEPGCSDPWGGPPITWTFKDGSMEDPPGFEAPTFSHMPRCDGANFCAGSGAYTHLGLQLVKDNQAAYLAQAQMMGAPYPATDSTPFINILIVDGQYTGYSTDAQVQAELEDMYSAGITTYVIGFGDGVNAPQAELQLADMASWGSGGMQDWYDANNDAELAQALAAIAAEIDYDPCCAFADCSGAPEPNPTDPDPVPPPTTDSGDTGAETDSGGTSTDGGGTSTDGGSTSTDGDSDTSGDSGTSGDSDTSGDGGTETGGDGGTGGSGGMDEVGDDTGTGTGADVGADSDEGCSCSTERGTDKTGGLLGALLAFGLAGFRRRRREL